MKCNKDFCESFSYAQAFTLLSNMLDVELYDEGVVTVLKELFYKDGFSYFPEILREFFEKLPKVLKLIAWHHLLKYKLGGNKEDFLQANKDFEECSIKEAGRHYCIIDPRRYFVVRQVKRYRKLCDRFGWIVWKKENF